MRVRLVCRVCEQGDWVDRCRECSPDRVEEMDINEELPNMVAALLRETFRIRTLDALDASFLDADDVTRKMAAGLLCDEIGPVAVEAALGAILEEFDRILAGSIMRTVEMAKREQMLASGNEDR